MGVRLSEDQQRWVDHAVALQEGRESMDGSLARTVKVCLAGGVPLNTLATALGVSRSRVRRLARVEKSE